MGKVKFKIGDTVTLKSGGPLMAVVGKEEKNMSELAGKPNEFICNWFVNGNLNKNSFPESALIKGKESNVVIYIPENKRDKSQEDMLPENVVKKGPTQRAAPLHNEK